MRRHDDPPAPGPLAASLDTLAEVRAGCPRRLTTSQRTMAAPGAEAVIRAVPVVLIPGLRKTYVRRSDVHALIEARTFTNDQVPA